MALRVDLVGLMLQSLLWRVEGDREVVPHELMAEGWKHRRNSAVLFRHVGLESHYLLLKCLLECRQKGADL